MIIAFDLDGTLVKDDKSISDYTLKVLRKLKEKGHKLVGCTGRAMATFPDCLKDICSYCILCNGALIYDFINDKYLVANSLNEELINKINDTCLNLDVDIDYFTCDAVYTDKYTYDNLEKYTLNDEGLIKMIRNGRKIVDDPKAYCLNNKLDILRLNIFVSSLDFKEDLMNRLKKLDIEVTTSLPTNIEITARGCNKGNGLTKLCEYINVPLDEVMMCGDSDNDITALKIVGVSVVLKNGFEHVKKLADYITDEDCNNDGLANFLNNYFNLNLSE